MIDPTNRQPMPEHHSPRARVLAVSALVVLVVLILGFFIQTQYFGKSALVEEIFVVPPSSEEVQKNSILTKDAQAEFVSIQERVNSGELSREEAERQMNELFKRVPPPAQPTAEQ